MLAYFILLFYAKILFSSPYCKEGENYCIRCNPITDLCEKCTLDIFILNEYGICEKAQKCIKGINYCMECNPESNLCLKCEEGYYPDANGGCTYTDNCEISFRGECLKCNQDSVLIGNGVKICKSLNSESLNNCERVNIEDGTCFSCKEGYYLNKGDKKCINIQKCEESLFGVCKKCSGSYYLDKKENICKEFNGKFNNCKESLDGINCEVCLDDFYFDEEKNCIACNYCSLGYYYRCDKCIEGYYLSEDKYSCTKDENCGSGDKDLGICTKCKNGYYIENGKCKPNTEQNEFKYCSSSNGELCNECSRNTYLGKDNQCSFSKYCSESLNNTCIECIDGYHLDVNNKCSNIVKCIRLDDDYNCIECELNYYFNKSSNECEIETDYFKNCKYTTNDGKICERCRNYFYYNKSDHLCYSNSNKDNFYKCEYTFNEGEYCIKCVEGYYLGYIDHKCTKIEGCYISENENKCIMCDSEKYCLDMSTGKCEYNDIILSEEKKFYYKCNKTSEDGNNCESCIYGFSLNSNGLCNNDLYCLEKNEDTSCNICTIHSENYNYLCLNSDFGCVETYYSNCFECNDIFNFDNCTQCKEGFQSNQYNHCVKINE